MSKIMVQGTASSVGKSILVTALCRILKEDGYKICPFKSQNMSLNSYITLDGKEMGRAQVLQAYAAGLEPEAYMNPILLKPTTDKRCQVIVKGKVYGNTSAMEYHELKPVFKDMLKEDFMKLESEYDAIVMEGAGSPAEINLRDRDIVNMGMAELVDAPVILVGDIDKGGVFASLAGTMMLLKEEEKSRVKGFVINKFRGDVDILKPGIDMIEDIIKIPCLGVVPHFTLKLEDEDSAITFNNKSTKDIDIVVIKLPHISNFTDFDAFSCEEDVSIRFVTDKKDFGSPDLVIIPGSKNTIEDLLFLRDTGLEDVIKDYSNDNMIIGICGGYQMLGNTIKDPYCIETNEKEVKALGLLDIETIFEREKTMTRVEGSLINISKSKNSIYGYEIHLGKTIKSPQIKSIIKINKVNDKEESSYDGGVNLKGNIMGTYIHGIFDAPTFRQHILNPIRKKKLLQERESPSYESLREKELDKLAKIVRESLDMDKVYKIINLK
ncbi:cobyric acid synthase [Clostridium algidicarnis]|uniref:cobyric acid synthase n=1 Tax=Clostridium algidicarnis TaxID=37659 RepID=UPI001C0C4DC9|nr:cobyric acid synthase [Clostridium algidicarnis]MBU3227520.1 cobyric acid synthase [Clostridium algidicarnis]MBU3251073.1 cobyric acid synthase [Clostridium algidicarnis]